MSVTAVRIAWADDGEVSGRLVEGGRSPGLLLAHGAGTDQDHPGIVELRNRLTATGRTVLTFNYPYTEAGRRRPDPQHRLLACHRAALDWYRTHVGEEVVLAGRSMGGRMGTYLAASGEPCTGLILFAYPLHPAGRPDRLRVDHLPDVTVPMLFVTGTRDPLCRLDLYDRWVRPLPTVTTLLVEDGDHSFRVPKRTGRLRNEVMDGVFGAVDEWLDAR